MVIYAPQFRGLIQFTLEVGSAGEIIRLAEAQGKRLQSEVSRMTSLPKGIRHLTQLNTADEFS